MEKPACDAGCGPNLIYRELLMATKHAGHGVGNSLAALSQLSTCALATCPSVTVHIVIAVRMIVISRRQAGSFTPDWHQKPKLGFGPERHVYSESRSSTLAVGLVLLHTNLLSDPPADAQHRDTLILLTCNLYTTETRCVPRRTCIMPVVNLVDGNNIPSACLLYGS